MEMKRIGLLVLLLLSLTTIKSQVGNTTDVEYIEVCMVDSIGGNNSVRFLRIINPNTLSVIDIDPVSGTPYTILGTGITCEAFDLTQLQENPLDTLYENCECRYTISQENHRVAELLGGISQLARIEFDEVVVRQCADGTEAVEIYRQQIVEFGNINVINPRVYTQLTYNIGQYLSSTRFRLFSEVGTNQTNQLVVTVDFDPNTVQSSYPGLILAPDDFIYDGTNIIDMAIAYELVANHALGQAGVLSYPIDVIALGNQIIINSSPRHRPELPHALLLTPDDPSFQLVRGNTGLGVSHVNGTGPFITRTSQYAAPCGTINTEQSAFYLRWDRETPLDILPIFGPTQTVNQVESNPTVFCEVSPEVCRELSPNPIDLDGCVEVCSDVLNIAGHMALRDSVMNFTGASYNSISFYVTQGPVQVIVNGEAINYPSGWTGGWGAADNQLIQNEIIVDTSEGEALISYVK